MIECCTAGSCLKKINKNKRIAQKQADKVWFCNIKRSGKNKLKKSAKSVHSSVILHFSTHVMQMLFAERNCY